MEFKKHLSIIIGIPLAICLILIISLFYFSSNITRLVDKIKQAQTSLYSKTEMAGSLALLRQDSEKVKYYSAELENILPDRDQLLIDFSNDLNIIAKQNQIDFNLILGQEILKTSAELGGIDFTVISQGSFDNFLNFLEALKKNKYFIKFKSIDINRQDKIFKTSLSGQVFSF